MLISSHSNLTCSLVSISSKAIFLSSNNFCNDKVEFYCIKEETLYCIIIKGKIFFIEERERERTSSELRKRL